MAKASTGLRAPALCSDVETLEGVAAMLNVVCIVSKSPMRFMSWEMIASFSSSFFCIDESCSLSLLFSDSTPEENAPDEVPMTCCSPPTFPAGELPMLAVSYAGNMGCCRWPGVGPNGTWNSCGKQLGVVIPDICDICDGDWRSG